MCMSMMPCEEDLCHDRVLAMTNMNSPMSVVRFMTSMKSPISVSELHDSYELIWISMSFMTSIHSLVSMGKIMISMNLLMYIGKVHDKYGICV